MDFLPQRTFTNFNFRKKNSKNKIKLPRIDTAFISFNDYERIKKNAIVTKDEEILQNEFIQKEQETSKLAKANALKEKIKNINPQNNIQITHNKNYHENDLMLEAKKHLDKNEDCVKHMEKLSLFAKVATIRERQLKEHEMMEDLYKRKEKKLDEMMELERLKELKQQQNRENNRKQLQRDGCLLYFIYVINFIIFRGLFNKIIIFFISYFFFYYFHLFLGLPFLFLHFYYYLNYLLLNNF